MTVAIRTRDERADDGEVVDDRAARDARAAALLAGDGDPPLTRTGIMLGTPQYMAPEQCEGRPDIDHRADLFALGLVGLPVMRFSDAKQLSAPLTLAEDEESVSQHGKVFPLN